ncbi:NAD(P)H-binding protein [Microbacterium stercoris]|uniref:NAD(P)H-binding protein n=1 Tax=Microbacterium stercoris TaxID=2820289 RepID=A0A939QLM6_9MICO|nr:NAD(P)H-binding protein [Microbacterium stercoris]MBO3663972.1 NAD(P)H-binding protein [Microbacterium stercoris]
MSIAVTGASGRLGSFAIDALIARGVSPTDIVAITRTPEGVRFRDRAVTVRQADYNDPASMDLAFRGVERLLLIASTEVGHRLTQHRNVIAAAERAWVGCLVYTSSLGADSGHPALEEHRQTEEALGRSGIPATILRNGAYLDTFMERAQRDVARGEVVGGTGRVSAAHRRDYADAAAAAILTPRAGRVYELGGETFTAEDYVRELSRAAGRPIAFRRSEENQGLGDVLSTDSDELRMLLGHRPTSLGEAVDLALAGALHPA